METTTIPISRRKITDRIIKRWFWFLIMTGNLRRSAERTEE
jgi:hypothetical protein